MVTIHRTTIARKFPLASTALGLALSACGGGDPATPPDKTSLATQAAPAPNSSFSVSASPVYKLSAFSRANCINNESITWDRSGQDWDLLVVSYQRSDLGDYYEVQCEREGMWCGAIRVGGGLLPGQWTVEGMHGISASRDPFKRQFLREWCDDTWLDSGLPAADICKETRATTCNLSEF